MEITADVDLMAGEQKSLALPRAGIGSSEMQQRRGEKGEREKGGGKGLNVAQTWDN